MTFDRGKWSECHSLSQGVTDLFRKQTVHDEEHDPLKAAKDGEQVRHDYGALLELETPKNPHGAQNTQLGHCSNGECPAGGNTDMRR